MDIRQATLTHLDPSVLQTLAEIRPNLILVFAAPHHFAQSGLSDVLSAIFPDAIRMGASTAGEISSRGVEEGRLVVTAVRFDRIDLHTAVTDLVSMEDSRAAGQRLSEQLPAEGLRAVILLSQGVGVNGSDLIVGLSAGLGANIPLTGGLAGDNGAFHQTWTLLNERVSSSQLVALGLYGEALGFAHGSFGGWQSFGPARQATRSRGNVLFELDGAPALDIYKRYLGNYAAELPASGLLFPFALLADDQQESGLIRTLLGINEADGSLILAGDVPEGGYLRLMHASTEALVDGAEAAALAAARMLQDEGPSLGLLISCVGRKLVMGDRVEEEVEAVGSVFGAGCVLAGFYSNGEISPFLETMDCKLHNQTMTITCIVER